MNYSHEEKVQKTETQKFKKKLLKINQINLNFLIRIWKKEVGTIHIPCSREGQRRSHDVTRSTPEINNTLDYRLPKRI